MNYKCTGRLYSLDDDTRHVWGYLSPHALPQPIPEGSTIMLSDTKTGCTNMLKVVPNTQRICDNHCWAYSHMESQYCRTLLGCENTDKGTLHHHIKVICVDELLEDL